MGNAARIGVGPIEPVVWANIVVLKSSTRFCFGYRGGPLTHSARTACNALHQAYWMMRHDMRIDLLKQMWHSSLHSERLINWV